MKNVFHCSKTHHGASGPCWMLMKMDLRCIIGLSLDLIQVVFRWRWIENASLAYLWPQKCFFLEGGLRMPPSPTCEPRSSGFLMKVDLEGIIDVQGPVELISWLRWIYDELLHWPTSGPCSISFLKRWIWDASLGYIWALFGSFFYEGGFRTHRWPTPGPCSSGFSLVFDIAMKA